MIFGGIPNWSALVEGTAARFKTLVTSGVAALGAGSTISGVQAPVTTVRIDAGATVTPDVTDHGKVIRLTNATPVVNLPAISAVFEGYQITLLNASGGNDAAVNRDGADTIDPATTTFKIQVGNGINVVRLKVVGGVWFTSSRWFRSTNTALPTGNTAQTNIAHNLGGTPIIFFGRFRCSTADNGYEVGDEVDSAGARLIDNSGSASDYQVVLQANATNVSYMIAGTALGRALPSEGAGVLTGLTMGSWQFFVWACYPGAI